MRLIKGITEKIKKGVLLIRDKLVRGFLFLKGKITHAFSFIKEKSKVLFSKVREKIKFLYTKIKEAISKLSPKQRKIIKIGCISLGCLLLLTILFNTVHTLLLPKVHVAEVEEGDIYKKVRGNGQLESGKTHIIYADSNAIINKIYVGVGDTVSANQPLLQREGVETEAMKAEKEALNSMELEYEKKLLQFDDEYGVSDLLIEDAKQQLEDAKDAETQAEEDKDSIESLKKKISAKERELANLETTYRNSENKLGDKTLESTTSLESDVSKKEKELKALQDEKAALEADLKEEKKKKKKEQDQDKIKSLNTEISELKKEIDEKNSEVTDAKNQLSKVKQANATTQQLINAKNSAESAYEKAQKDLNELEEELQELEAGYINVDDAKNTVSQNELELRELLLKEQQDKLDFEQLESKLEEQRLKVNGLYRSVSANSIVSPVAGVVSEINCAVSKSVAEGQALITVKEEVQGYLLELQVDKKQAEYLQIGDEAQILNIWDEDVSAYISDIKASVEDPDKCKAVEFTVEGENLTIGQNIAVSVGEMQEYYDLIVPLNALHEDNEGQFVFVLVEESTLFGSRYYVERYNVEVMASDDTHAAVMGDFYVEDYVVTQSMEPLEDYGKVRLVD